MSLYPLQPRSLSAVINQSFRYYGLAFKAVFPLVFLAAIVKDAYIYFGMPANRWLSMVIFLIMVLLEVYLWSVAWYLVNSRLSDLSIRLGKAFREVYYKISLIYAGFFALIIAVWLIFFMGYLLSELVSWIFSHNSLTEALSILIFIGVPLTIFLVLIFPMLPLLVLDKMTIWQAFYKSISWVGYRNWFRVFILYAAHIIAFFIVSPSTAHGQWITRHYLNVVFDVIVLLILGPFLVNFMLFLINDLRLRDISTFRVR